MKKNRIIFSSLFMLCLGLLPANAYQKNGNSVTIPVEQQGKFTPKWVRLQVVNDRIIRVEATSETAFPEKESLIIVKQPENNVPYKVEEDSRVVKVATAKLVASVDKATGRVVFCDSKGRQILAEDALHSKTIVPYTVPEREIGVDSHVTEAQRHGYTWRLLFDNAQDDGFYGLGQHQANELNMKGKNEDLYQYNTKVSVPFVVSNKNYGILWDSYSYCRFGNPNEYQQLNRAFTLYDKNGEKGHLTGTYTAADGKQIVRNEDSIYYEFALPALAAKGLTDVGFEGFARHL